MMTLALAAFSRPNLFQIELKACIASFALVQSKRHSIGSCASPIISAEISHAVIICGSYGLHTCTGARYLVAAVDDLSHGFTLSRGS